MRRRLLVFEAVFEAATGLALIAAPSTVSQLLLGEGVSGVGTVVARVAGIALLALACACWPSGRDSGASAVRALLIYNAAVAGFLAYSGLQAGFVGSLLWPAVAVHALVTALLVLLWFRPED